MISMSKNKMMSPHEKKKKNQLHLPFTSELPSQRSCILEYQFPGWKLQTEDITRINFLYQSEAFPRMADVTILIQTSECIKFFGNLSGTWLFHSAA